MNRASGRTGRSLAGKLGAEVKQAYFEPQAEDDVSQVED
jgi:hypothetical protein